MNIEKMTEHEKTLLIAKVMYGEMWVQQDIVGVWVTELIKYFNPYKDGNDSQAVQEFLGIEAAKQNYDGEKEWFCQTPTSHVISHNTDLKTAIADCAVKIIMDKEKHDD